MKAKDIVDRFSTHTAIYLREKESQQLTAFLASKDPIFHVTGSPGTGKTATVKSVLSGISFTYVNYFLEPKIAPVLRKSKPKVAVIDEFDKYFEEKRNECVRLLLYLRSKGKKVVTISNDLRMGNLRFQPYTAAEMAEMLRRKMDAVGGEFMSRECVEFLAKKYEKSGDARALFKAVVTALVRKAEECDQDGEGDVRIEENKGNAPQQHISLGIRDFIESEKTPERGLHHELARKIKAAGLNKTKGYGKYLEECEECGIPPVTKGDFFMLFDMG